MPRPPRRRAAEIAPQHFERRRGLYPPACTIPHPLHVLGACLRAVAMRYRTARPSPLYCAQPTKTASALCTLYLTQAPAHPFSNGLLFSPRCAPSALCAALPTTPPSFCAPARLHSPFQPPPRLLHTTQLLAPLLVACIACLYLLPRRRALRAAACIPPLERF